MNSKQSSKLRSVDGASEAERDRDVHDNLYGLRDLSDRTYNNYPRLSWEHTASFESSSRRSQIMIKLWQLNAQSASIPSSFKKKTSKSTEPFWEHLTTVGHFFGYQLMHLARSLARPTSTLVRRKRHDFWNTTSRLPGERIAKFRLKFSGSSGKTHSARNFSTCKFHVFCPVHDGIG